MPWRQHAGHGEPRTVILNGGTHTWGTAMLIHMCRTLCISLPKKLTDLRFLTHILNSVQRIMRLVRSLFNYLYDLEFVCAFPNSYAVLFFLEIDVFFLIPM